VKFFISTFLPSFYPFQEIYHLKSKTVSICSVLVQKRGKSRGEKCSVKKKASANFSSKTFFQVVPFFSLVFSLVGGGNKKINFLNFQKIPNFSSASRVKMDFPTPLSVFYNLRNKLREMKRK
jgi:hypothetical protein